MKVSEGIEKRLHMLAGQVDSACRMGMWCFDEKKHLFYSTCQNQNEFLLFLNIGGCLDYIVENTPRYNAPVILSDPIGLIWISEFVPGNNLYIVMGPIFIMNISVDFVMERLRPMQISVMVQRKYVKILQEVPVIEFEIIRQYARMFHYTIYEEALREADIHYEISEQLEVGIPYRPEEDGVNVHGKTYYQRMDRVEQVILRAVESGDIHFTKRETDESFKGGLYDYGIGDPLRQAKINIFTFIAKCSQAAVRGGVPLKIAKELEVDYTRQVEQCQMITALQRINRMMLEDFIKHVYDHKSIEGLSEEIRNCCDYIKANYMKPIKLAEMAMFVGYSEYYLSKKFAREMGIKLQDYIKDVRLEAAKVQLITTDKGIQEISEQFQFGSRSYFDKIFQKKIGMTPVQYRANMGKV